MRIEIPNFESIRVLVVGDIMLDRYWHGTTSRISPEAPVPVVHVRELEERAGGAGNVALNLSALGCAATLIGVVGNDSAADKLESILQNANIDTQLMRLDGMPTITKVRVLGRNQQLLRLDFEEELNTLQTQDLIAIFNAQLPTVDMVIISDYGKGILHHVPSFIAAAKAAGIPVLIDPKSNDFSVYHGATVVTPNLKEFEAIVGPCVNEEEIVEKGYHLLNKHNFAALLITRSEQGMTLLMHGQEPLHLPTRAREVYDVTGAGDTVIAVFGATMAAGQAAPEAAALANIAAGIVVRKLGSATVSIPELRRALQWQFNSGFGVLTEEELLIAVADARAHGEVIVMTNGCFDILHAGHIQYLEQAKELGKRLIVAVNDDASVSRLKGSQRPINSLSERMAVLASLRVVDWVILFADDTPERLIKLISPDILVKGGDYQIHEIAGSDHVLAKGGEVKQLTFVQGCSTSAMINKIKELV